MPLIYGLCPDPYANHFTQADSIIPGAGNPQAWNRYAYVLNNPLKYTDPSGHDPVGWFCYEPNQPSCDFFKAMNETEGRKDNLSYFDEAWIRLFNTPHGQHQAISLAKKGAVIQWSTSGTAVMKEWNIVEISMRFLPFDPADIQDVDMRISSIAIAMAHEATHIRSKYSSSSLFEEAVAFERESRVREDLETQGYDIDYETFPVYNFTNIGADGTQIALDFTLATDLTKWWDDYPRLLKQYSDEPLYPPDEDWRDQVWEIK